MAAALIPALVSAAPSLIDLIVGLVTKYIPAAENAYGSGTGPVKFADVFSSVIGDLTKAATAGTIPKDLPNDETIKVVIQSVFSALKMSGALGSGVSTGANQVITLKPGQSLSIQVAV